ncbi:DNA topoisomerase 2-alpha [Frankliniella fusca]|uniref:DNA topoisomerase 2-alpha n=1 Tax=Frankliniella fusca TaxID=407009 RepID=A0AAE1GVG0_9NEOP|nr:DNA topoisomerase 2-alpha [Frankliniella fusca]
MAKNKRPEQRAAARAARSATPAPAEAEPARAPSNNREPAAAAADPVRRSARRRSRPRDELRPAAAVNPMPPGQGRDAEGAGTAGAEEGKGSTAPCSTALEVPHPSESGTPRSETCSGRARTALTVTLLLTLKRNLIQVSLSVPGPCAPTQARPVIRVLGQQSRAPPAPPLRERALALKVMPLVSNAAKRKRPGPPRARQECPPLRALDGLDHAQAAGARRLDMYNGTGDYNLYRLQFLHHANLMNWDEATRGSQLSSLLAQRALEVLLGKTSGVWLPIKEQGLSFILTSEPTRSDPRRPIAARVNRTETAEKFSHCNNHNYNKQKFTKQMKTV